MYGLLLEAITEAIINRYGEEAWEKIKQKADIRHKNFERYHIYSETYVKRIATAGKEILGSEADDLMHFLGQSFVQSVTSYGYGDILSVVGRHLRDFLNGLDNLHEFLRFSYPKIKPPSFLVLDENRSGITLQYRTKRRGFNHYVIGTLEEVSLKLYDCESKVEITNEQIVGDVQFVTFKMTFDNVQFQSVNRPISCIGKNMLINSELFFYVFPFSIVFNQNMVITKVGAGLNQAMDYLVGQVMDEMFYITRPLISFSWEAILTHVNNVFELLSIDTIGPAKKSGDESKCIQFNLRGQMLYMDEFDSIFFLGSPIMSDLQDMFKSGLYLNDLSMHDSSRDLVLSGTQQSVEIKLALDQEEQKTKQLEESMSKLDIEIQRTDALLYQLIPKSVATQLRKGVNAINTCRAYDCVSVVFTDIKGFTNICSGLLPIQVVKMLNTMYTLFDRLSEIFGVYKVETIGDAYMGVAGAPELSPTHANDTVDMALNMNKAVALLHSPNGETMQIRAGIHSGSVVSGVVGIKMPRYCLFGTVVTIANFMESSGVPTRVQISQSTYDLLSKDEYDIELRGPVEITGCGEVVTYFVNKKLVPFSKCDFNMENLIHNVEAEAEAIFAEAVQ